MAVALYDGLDATALAERLSLPRVEIRDKTTSTLDIAHGVAGYGAPAGTLVLANTQTRGRGRNGAQWIGIDGASILCTIIERPATVGALEVLSLRIGLLLAHALDSFSDARMQVKWPNDLMIEGGKVAGILIETRWRARAAEWVAVAAGINVGAPPSDVVGARGLRAGTQRLDVLDAIVPAMRCASATEGGLTDVELADWESRDALRGRRIVSPGVGLVTGILASGELVVKTPEGLTSFRSGSVTLEEENT